MRLLISGSLESHMTKAGQVPCAGRMSSAENIDVADKIARQARLVGHRCKTPIQALVEQLEEERVAPAGRGLWNRASRRQNRRRSIIRCERLYPLPTDPN